MQRVLLAVTLGVILVFDSYQPGTCNVVFVNGQSSTLEFILPTSQTLDGTHGKPTAAAFHHKYYYANETGLVINAPAPISLDLDFTKARSNESIGQSYRAWMEVVVSRRWDDRYNVVFWIAIIPSLSIVALFGNIIVIMVACISRQFRSCSCIFLTNLAVIDTVQTAVIVPMKVMEFFVIKFPISDSVTCKFAYLTREALYICYMQTFVLIAIERFIVVVYPMKALQLCTKKRARHSVFFIWVLSFFLAIPSYFQTDLVGEEFDWPICARDIIRKNYPDWVDINLWRNLHECYSLFILYVMPFSALLVCYSVVAIALHRSIKAAQFLTHRSARRSTAIADDNIRANRMTNRRNQSIRLLDMQKERILVLRMCIVLVSFFGLCQGPWRLQYWQSVLYPDAVPAEVVTKLKAPFFALVILNSAVNPVVYGFMSRNFRRAFTIMIAKWCMIPIRIYRRSVLRWHLEKETLARRLRERNTRKTTVTSDGIDIVVKRKVPSAIRLGALSGSLPELLIGTERIGGNTLQIKHDDNDCDNNIIDSLTTHQRQQVSQRSCIILLLDDHSHSTTMTSSVLTPASNNSEEGTS